MTISFTPEETIKHFYSALCNSLSLLPGYGLDFEFNNAEYKQAAAKLPANRCYEDVLIQILKDGGTLTINDIEGEGEYTRTITLQDVYMRLPKTPINDLINIINEDDDANTGDAILQTVFFESVVFG